MIKEIKTVRKETRKMGTIMIGDPTTDIIIGALIFCLVLGLRIKAKRRGK